MPGPTRSMYSTKESAVEAAGTDDLIARLQFAEASCEEAILECEELRDQLNTMTAECNSLGSQLTATVDQLGRMERLAESMRRQRSRDQETIHVLETRLAASQAEASNAEEEFHVSLEELEVSSRSLAESNLQLYELTRTLERQVDERTADLRASLADREALIEEIHHQTRNNLQIIASLLNLQANRIGEQSAAEVRRSLARIQSMSLVHGLVFDEGSRADTPALPLLTELCRQLASKGESSGGIAIDVNGQTGRIPLNAASPLGLIVAELVSNALSHAFPDASEHIVEDRRVRVEVYGNPATNCIVIHDNGIGMDPSAPNDRRGLGLLLVRTLARQANAEVRFLRDNGTKVEIHLRSRRSGT